MIRFIAKAPGASYLEIDGDFLVFDGAELHRLVGSAADIWRSIQGSTPVEDVVRRVQELHPVDPRVSDDVRLFINDLIAEGLAQEAPGAGVGFAVPPHVAWCADSDDTVLIADLRSGERFRLSTVGASIWSSAVVEGRSLDASRDALVEDYPDAPEDVEAVIGDLVDSLVDAGLIEGRPQTRPASH